MQPLRFALRRAAALALAAGIVLGLPAWNVPSARAATIRGITLHAFTCSGPALEYSLTGDFTDNDGSGLDNVRVRILDGANTLLFDIIGGSAGTLDWRVAVADSTGAAPDPRVNPIRFEVYEYVGQYPNGMATDVLATAAFDVPCLVPATPPPGSPSFVGPYVPAGAVRLPAATRFTANVHRSPSAASQRFESIRPGTPLLLIGRDIYNMWALAVLPDGRSGWVSMNLLDIMLEEIQVLTVRR